MTSIEATLAALDEAPHYKARAARLAGWRQSGSHRGETIAQVVDTNARRAPDVAVIFGSLTHGHASTIGLLAAEAREVAAGLRALGYAPGDRIVIQMPNWREGAVAFLAAQHLGLVVVPVIAIYGATELTHIARVTQAKGLIIPDRWMKFDFADRIAALGDLPDLRDVIVVGDGAFGREVIRWPALLGKGSIDAPYAGPSDGAALINFTSGTTSEPKGVVHSHDTMLFEVPGFPNVLSPADLPSLWPLPAGHIAGIIALLRPFVCDDASILIDQWDENLICELIERYRPDRCGAAPFHVDFYARHARRLMGYGVLQMTVGAASVPPALIERIEAIGIPATRSYGCTELPTISGGWPTDPLPKRAYTDGRLLKDIEVRLVGEDGGLVGVGEPGEIVAIGAELFKGYLNPAHNESAFTEDGWFRTGDIGVIDADGFLTIVDRKKDIVIRGGENISSREVEDVLCRHPAIVDSAVVAWPDDRYGEKVAAFVMVKPGQTLAVEALAGFFREQGVAIQKTPEHLIIVDQLPRNGIGKVTKAPLRDQARAMAAEQRKQKEQIHG